MSHDSQNNEGVSGRDADLELIGVCYADWIENHGRGPNKAICCEGYAYLYVDPLSVRKKIRLSLELGDVFGLSDKRYMVINAHLDEKAALWLIDQLRDKVIEHIRLNRDQKGSTPRS